MQSKRGSLTETLTNFGVGVFINLILNAVALPLVGLPHPSIYQNVGMIALFTLTSLARSYVLRRMFNGFDRPPDLIIGQRSDPQTLRWHLLKWRGTQLALHKWLRSDDDRALHDHRAWNISVILWGGYWEVLRGDMVVWRRAWVPYFRRAETPHRVVLDAKYPVVWSLWLRGKPWRQWGFHCPKGWKSFPDFLATRDYSAPGSVSEKGKGCDD